MLLIYSGGKEDNFVEEFFEYKQQLLRKFQAVLMTFSFNVREKT